MTLFEAIVLGIVQGLTEFLPVSSSGHLELGKAILGSEQVPKEGLLFTVVVHAATALSTLVVFRKDVWEIIRGLFQFKWNEELKFSLKVLLSMIPAAFVGLFFEEQIESLFSGNILLVGGMLVITALLLFLGDRAKRTDRKVHFTDALVIGVAQAIAILPGISRSGATISTSVLLGIDRERAARFSFLMVVPLILGKMAKDLMSGEVSAASESAVPLLAGFICAFLAGVLACRWMVMLVKRSKLTWFAGYCLLVGIIALVLSW